MVCINGCAFDCSQFLHHSEEKNLKHTLCWFIFSSFINFLSCFYFEFLEEFLNFINRAWTMIRSSSVNYYFNHHRFTWNYVKMPIFLCNKFRLHDTHWAHLSISAEGHQISVLCKYVAKSIEALEKSDKIDYI